MSDTYLILVVEDNDMNREIVIRRLIKQGYKTIQAVDGQEGVDKALKELPDLIIMDINLPVLDGMEATRQIKAHDTSKNIPIIALTAHVQPEDRAVIMASGCDEFETKPVNFEILFNKIKALIQKP
jgi:two-component system cell cycle response regulator DivK